jgi:hypothetical protein
MWPLTWAAAKPGCRGGGIGGLHGARPSRVPPRRLLAARLSTPPPPLASPLRLMHARPTPCPLNPPPTHTQMLCATRSLVETALRLRVLRGCPNVKTLSGALAEGLSFQQPQAPGARSDRVNGAEGGARAGGRARALSCRGPSGAGTRACEHPRCRSREVGQALPCHGRGRLPRGPSFPPPPRAHCRGRAARRLPPAQAPPSPCKPPTPLPPKCAPGVVLRGGTVLPADLVVDASGRGSRTPEWLEAGGWAPPPTVTVDSKLVGCGAAGSCIDRLGGGGPWP